MMYRAALHELTQIAHGTRELLYVGPAESQKVHCMRQVNAYLAD